MTIFTNKPQPFRIGITGPKGSGKTTLALTLVECLAMQSKTVIHTAFAVKLKQALHIMFGGEARNWFGSYTDKEEVAGEWGARFGEKYSTYRRIMQQFGTDIIRNNLSRDMWLFALVDEVRGYDTNFVIVDDVRFENEASWIREYGVLIHVSRAGVTYDGTHSSELGVRRDCTDNACTPESVEELKHITPILAANAIKLAATRAAR